MAAKVISEDEQEQPCMVTTQIGGVVYRCGKTGVHDDHEAQAPEYAVIDWRAAFGHARPVLELIALNPGGFDDRLVASARRALLFAEGKKLSTAPGPRLVKTRA